VSFLRVESQPRSQGSFLLVLEVVPSPRIKKVSIMGNAKVENTATDSNAEKLSNVAFTAGLCFCLVHSVLILVSVVCESAPFTVRLV